MKINPLLLSVLGLFVMASAAQAAPQCWERVNSARSGRATPLKISQDTYKRVGKALKHYRSVVLDGVSEWPAYISEFKEFRLLGVVGPILTGYEVDITDGGDESTVTYTFNGKGKLLKGFLHNQSPETYWFCEK